MNHFICSYDIGGSYALLFISRSITYYLIENIFVATYDEIVLSDINLIYS